MKSLGVLFGVLLAVTVGRAQSQIDSVFISVTDLWVHHSSVTQGGASDSSYPESFTHRFGVPTPNSYDNDTIIVHANAPYYFRLHFNEDTTRASVWLSGAYLRAERMEVHAPVINTPDAFVIDLDSALIHNASEYSYRTYDDLGGHGGYKYYKEQTSSSDSKLLPTTRITFKFFKQLPLNVGVQSQNAVRVYPNPAQTTLTVVVPETKPSHLTLTDMFGREMFVTLVYDIGEIDVSQFNPGVYILRAAGQTRKVVIE